MTLTAPEIAATNRLTAALEHLAFAIERLAEESASKGRFDFLARTHALLVAEEAERLDEPEPPHSDDDAPFTDPALFDDEPF
jgi:hypothetical protein